MSTLIWLVLALTSPMSKELLKEQPNVNEEALRCRESYRCASAGECTPGVSVETGKTGCIIASDTDCSLSLECWMYGACHFDAASKTCVVKDQAFCENSGACGIKGICQYLEVEDEDSDEIQTYQVCSPTPEACQNSFWCKAMQLTARPFLGLSSGVAG